jgi:hypothetical protein
LTRTYRTPESFKVALESRIRRAADAHGTTVARERALVVFGRLLARIDRAFGRDATLKGGLALELRLARARATRDIDLRLTGAPERLLERLQAAGRLDLQDFQSFEILPDPTQPEIRNDGLRFRAVCELAGRSYGDPFGLDIAFGDPILGEPTLLEVPSPLDFIGVPPSAIRIYPIESHLAEKLHAYTLPRPADRPNSRVKDLPDLALLATTGPLQAHVVRAALTRTFEFRGTHPVPRALPEPPNWDRAYARLAADDGLPWRTLPVLLAVVRRFLDPVLAGEATGEWSPPRWAWSPRPTA